VGFERDGSTAFEGVFTLLSALGLGGYDDLRLRIQNYDTTCIQATATPTASREKGEGIRFRSSFHSPFTFAKSPILITILTNAPCSPFQIIPRAGSGPKILRPIRTISRFISIYFKAENCCRVTSTTACINPTTSGQLFGDVCCCQARLTAVPA